MTSLTGLTPPPHRRFNQREAVEMVFHRYQRLNGMFDKQLRLLQASDAFLKECETYYAEGYKDWHILSAIFNCLLNSEANRRGFDPRNPETRNRFNELAGELKDVKYPEGVFTDFRLRWYFTIHLFTCLNDYGFDDRGLGAEETAIKKFMRERMLFFEIDIEHPLMFVNPPAWWPKLPPLETQTGQTDH